MKSVRKYDFVPDNYSSMHIRVPLNAEFLKVGLDPKGNHCFWALVDDDEPMRTVEIVTLKTDEGVYSDGEESMDYLGTYTSGVFVWHLFEVINEESWGLVRCTR